MKKYEELTDQQRVNAVAIAKAFIEEQVNGVGILVFEKPMSEAGIEKMAHVVAEESRYDDNGRPIQDEVDNNLPPSFYQGGCV